MVWVYPAPLPDIHRALANLLKLGREAQQEMHLLTREAYVVD